MENPFSVSFGTAPTSLIRRENELLAIRESFDASSPRSRAFVISGPRGVGKTVALSYLLETYRQKENFLVARLDVGGDMLVQLLGSLYEKGKSKHLFAKAEFSFSFQGFGLSIKGENPVSDVRSFVTKILSYLKKKGIRTIIAIDDVAKTEETVNFIRSFQGFLIDGYDVCLLMTGLYENVESVSSEKTLTFLKRAPKIYLGKLSIAEIALSYASIFSLPLEEAVPLAKFVNGYAYGFQVLGDILFRKGKRRIDADVTNEFDQALREGVYDILFSELSPMEIKILIAIAQGATTNESLKESLNMADNYLSVYKDRLIKKGLIEKEMWGKMVLALPRLKEYLLLQSLLFAE